MALNFPGNPILNQEYTSGGLVYRWNGNSWISVTDISTILSIEGLATETYVDDAVSAIVIPDVSNFITVDDIPAIPVDISDLTDTTNLLGAGVADSLTSNNDINITVNNEDSSNYTWNFGQTGNLTLPAGGIIAETVVTDNPTIVIQPADAEAESQALFIKGGVAFSNTENGITISVTSLTYAQGDTVTVFVDAPSLASTTLYWWVDQYSPGDKFTPDTGELIIDENGFASFDFVVNDATVPFRVYVADVVYNAYVNNLGAVSLEMNGTGGNGDVDTSLHLHLTTGDLTETSIFLGTDNHNVRTKADGAIELTSYDYDTQGTYKLTFKNRTLSIDGTVDPGDTDLFIKAGDDLYLDALNDDIHIRASDDVRIQPGYNFDTGEYAWQYRFVESSGVMTISDYNNQYGGIYPIFDDINNDRSLSLESENSTYIKSQFGTHIWKFGSDGNLTTEGDIVMLAGGSSSIAGRINNSVSDGGGLQIEAASDFEIKVEETANAGTPEETTETAIWSFDASGGITFPDATVQTTAYTGGDGGSSDSLVNGELSVTLGSDAVLTFPTAVFADENSILPAIHFPIPESSGGYIRVTTTGLGLQVIDNTWKFEADGSLTFPDASTQTTAWTGSIDWDDVTNTPTISSADTGNITFDDNTIQGNPLGTVGTQITVDSNYLGVTSQNSNVFNLSKTTDTDQVQVGWVIRGSSGSSTAQTITQVFDGGSYWQFFVAIGIQTEFPITIQSPDYQLGGGAQLILAVDPGDSSVKSWTFDSDGSVTFPDASTQTTAFTGNAATVDITNTNGIDTNYSITFVENRDGAEILRADVDLTFNSATNTLTAGSFSGDGSALTGVATKTSGEWAVTTGTNTYSFTVPGDGTYVMWVKGNIPNGIITWNATASVSNTNVPAIGTQYAWNYTGGGTPISLTSIPDQIKGVAGTISTDNTYVGSTSNRFDFGISNTSGSTQTVYYGYTKIS